MDIINIAAPFLLGLTGATIPVGLHLLKFSNKVGKLEQKVETNDAEIRTLREKVDGEVKNLYTKVEESIEKAIIKNNDVVKLIIENAILSLKAMGDTK